jgi:hypothetical protein
MTQLKCNQGKEHLIFYWLHFSHTVSFRGNEKDDDDELDRCELRENNHRGLKKL